MVWLRISMKGRLFATFHGSFQVIKPNPWKMWLILSPSLPSIKACLYAFGKLVRVLVLEVRIPGVQEIWVARAFLVSTKPNLSEEILVTKEREACFPSLQALQDLCSWAPSQRRTWHHNNGCILLFWLLIIDDYHYGSTLIIFVMVDVELYLFWLMYNCIY